MSNESVEVQLVRVSERLNTVISEMKDSKEARGKQSDKLDELGAKVSDMSSKVDNLERQMTSAEPTIKEFIEIRHKVVGAGVLGKWLWVVGAGLLGLIAGSRQAIFEFFSRGS